MYQERDSNMRKHIPALVLIAALLVVFFVTNEYMALRSAGIVAVVHFIKARHTTCDCEPRSGSGGI